MKKVEGASRYRTPPIKRTRDSFVDDIGRDVEHRIDLGEERSSQIRRDKDKVRGPNVGLHDIDYSVKAYIEEKVQPKVEENGVLIDVPILYASAELWASAQRNGYIRDKKGKTIAPVMTFRRTDVAMSQELMKNRVLPVDQYHYLSQKKYSNVAPYDRFGVMTNAYRKPREVYMSVVPTYVNITYDVNIWCYYQTQLNAISELLFHYNGTAFGEKNYYKFMGSFDNIAYENVKPPSGDKVVRGTTSLTIRGYIVNREVYGEVLVKRSVTPKMVVFNESDELNTMIPSWKSPDVYPYEIDNGEDPTIKI